MSEKTELTEPAEVIVLSTNHELRDELESNARRLEYGLQRAYLAWVALGLGERELSQLVNIKDPKRVVQEAIYSKNEASYKAMGLAKEAVMGLMELPPTWREFEKAASGLTTWGTNMPALSHFEIVKGEVVAKPSLKAWIDAKTQTTITHPKQIKAYREAEKLVRQIKDFEDEFGILVIPHSGGTSIFTRGVLVKGERLFDRERICYKEIFINKGKIKSIKTDE
jgi:hypothetical protein